MNSSGNSIDWYIVKGWGDKPIGALGFINNKVAAMTAFYNDWDGNKDGKMSITERFFSLPLVSPVNLKGKSITEVAMQARTDPKVFMRDPTFSQKALQIFLNFTRGIVIDAAYFTYLNTSVSKAASAIAKQITGNIVKEFVITKGMEYAVQTAVLEAFNRDGS